MSSRVISANFSSLRGFPFSSDMRGSFWVTVILMSETRQPFFKGRWFGLFGQPFHDRVRTHECVTMGSITSRQVPTAFSYRWRRNDQSIILRKLLGIGELAVIWHCDDRDRLAVLLEPIEMVEHAVRILIAPRTYWHEIIATLAA